MSYEERKVGLSVDVDPTRANQGLDQVAQAAKGTAQIVEQAGRKAGQSIDGIGDSSGRAAEKVNRDQRTMIAAMQRLQIAAEAGGKNTAAYFEKIGQIRGYDDPAFKRAVQGLQAIEAAQKSADSASVAAAANQAAFVASLREQIALQGKSTEEVLRYRAAQLGIGESAAPLILQLQNQKAAQAAAAQAAREEAESQKQAAVAKQRAADQQQSFIAGLRDQVAVQGKSQAEILRYRAAQLGVTKDAEQYIAQLERANASTGKIGVSAAQTAAALRGVPAQFTDIVTALQGGQQPLTVFLQQGGQLKDMFGGAGAAAKALGGYVLGLINPLTVTTAAVGVLGYAFYKGAQEQQDFQRTLILTGNAAGVTASQLGSIAAKVGSMGNGTTGRAAEVLNQIAASGKVAAGSLTTFTDAALKMERAGGPAAEETAKAFADLGKAPLEASLKLNESANYLTRSVYEQIKALEEQGKTVDAAAVAQKAYADSLNDRADAMVANLGYIEKGWKAIKKESAEALDTLLSIGRAEGPEQLIARLQTMRANKSVGLDGYADTNAGKRVQADIAAIDQEIARLSKRLMLTNDIAASEKQRADAVKAGVEFDKESDKYLTKREQMEREIAKARQVGLAAGREEADIARLVNEIRSKYDDGTSLQTVKNAEAQRLELIKRSQVEVDTLRQTGYLNERAAIEQNASLAVRAIDARASAVKAELALVAKKKDSEKEVASLQGELAKLTAERLTAEIKGRNDVVVALYKQQRAIEAVLDAQRQETADDRARFFVEESKARERIALSIYEYNRSLDDEAKRMQLEVSLLGASGVERQARLKQFEIELDLRKRLAEIDKTFYEGGDEEREQERARAREAAARASAQAQTRAYLDEWQKANDQLTQSLTDAITQGIMGGKGAAETLRKALVAALVTRPIQIAVQAMVQPIMGQLGQFMMGGQGTGMQGGSGMPWLTNFGGSVSGAVDTLGLNLYNAGFKDSGSWLMMNQGTIGQYANYAGQGLGYLNALKSASDGKWGSAAGSALGTYFGGPIGGAIGNSIGSMIDSAFGGNGKDFYGADYMASSKTGGYRPGEREVGDRQWGWSITGARSSQVEQTLQAITNSSLASLNQLQSVFGGKSEYKLGTYFSSNGENGSQGNIKFIKDGQTLAATSSGSYDKDATAGFKQYSSDVAKTVRDAMDAMGLPKWAQGMLDKLGEAPAIDDLVATVEQITKSQQALKSLGEVMPQFAKLTDNATASLLEAMGGADALAQSASSYYQNFYSEAERQAAASAQLGKAFGELGLAVPTTREAFRSLVEAQDLTTESGAKTYAALLKLNPAFASLVAASGEAAQSVDQAAQQMAEAGRKSLESLAQSNASLQVDLLRAQGKDGDALALQRKQQLDALLSGTSASDAEIIRAQFGRNAAIEDQITTLRQAAEAERAVAAERASLTSRLAEAQGDAAAARARELAAVDASNRAILEQIYALEDQKSAAAAAAAAMEKVNQAMSSLGGRRFDLENQILSLQGNDAEVARRIRERDLAQLTAGMTKEEADKITAAYDYNAALQQQLEALTAAKQAAEQAASAQAQAAQEQARAAEQVKQAWQSLTDSLMSEVQRIRGQMMEEGGGGLAATQARFAILTAQARAGDQEAVKLLPSLSQTMDGLAKAQATSLLELQSMRAATATSLEQTAAILASKFGVTLPKLATGTNYVPTTMPALLHEGEAVIPRAFNPAAGGYAQQEEMLAEMKALRAQNQQQGKALAELQLRMAQILERWDFNGIPEQRETTA